MKKDFDFDDIGKRTPYTTPDGFFEDVQRKSDEELEELVSFSENDIFLN